MRRAVARGALAATLGLAAACGSAPPPPKVARAEARAKPASATPHAAELDAGQIVLGLRGHEAELHDCFRLSGEETPAFAELTFDVTPDGIVNAVHVARSLAANPAVTACLGERLKEARFGHPGKPSQASWTFVGGLVRFEDADTRRRNRLNARRKNKKADESEQGIIIERSSPGKLDADAVEGIVQSGYKLFAHCYRDGLDRDPELGGAVRLRFVIGADGHVARVIDGGSDLPDENVVVCVAESFFALRFPKPEGGNVHLRYRIHFDSG